MRDTSWWTSRKRESSLKGTELFSSASHAVRKLCCRLHRKGRYISALFTGLGQLALYAAAAGSWHGPLHLSPLLCLGTRFAKLRPCLLFTPIDDLAPPTWTTLDWLRRMRLQREQAYQEARCCDIKCQSHLVRECIRKDSRHQSPLFWLQRGNNERRLVQVAPLRWTECPFEGGRGSHFPVEDDDSGG